MTDFQIANMGVICNSIGLLLSAYWEWKHIRLHKRMEQQDEIYRQLLSLEFERLEKALKMGNRIEFENGIWRISKIIKTKGIHP